MLKNGIDRSYGSSFFNFWEASILFSIVATPIYIPINSTQGSLYSTSCPTLIFCLFDDSHSNMCDVLSHCGFELHLFDGRWCWAPFLMPVGHLYVLFGKMSIQILCPIFNWIVLLLCSLYILNNNPLLDVWFVNIFSHFIGSLFNLLMVFLAVFLVWCRSTCLLSLLLSLLLVSNPKNYKDSCQGAYRLFYSRNLWFQILHSSL